MRTFIFNCLRLSFFVLLLSSCSSSKKGMNSGESDASVKRQIQSTYATITSALKAGHTEFVKDAYAKDAIIYMQNGVEIEGRDAIAQMYAGMLRTGTIIESRTEVVEVFGDLAYEIGTLHPLDRENKPTKDLRYMILWQKEGGNWKIYRDFVQGEE